MSYLRMCIESDMTSFKEPRLTSKPINPLGKTIWCLAALPGKLQGSLPGRCRNLRIYWDLEKRGNNPIVLVLQTKSEGKTLASEPLRGF